ncbi:MAG: alanine--tRNA ligase-related protein, partial [Acidimicrobiales bacterium]
MAFRLHDTFGFPIELTREIAAERGVDVDLAGFEAAMAEQRQRARDGAKGGASAERDRTDTYRDLLEEFGSTEFTGYDEATSLARVPAVVPLKGSGGSGGSDGSGATERGRPQAEVFLDRTPFYAEGGGQVGDTGQITTPTGVAVVKDTTYALPGLIRHLAVTTGDLLPGQEATAVIDSDRRAAIRRNHTATHLLHSALREVLGDHVKQQGSLVAPDRLRFDFSHFAAMTADENEKVEKLVNDRIITNEPVDAYETTRDSADEAGAVAIFGEKYGERVRVVKAGTVSVELCGGTHVEALGMIGPLKIVTEGSIGSNTRRIDAFTGSASLERIHQTEITLNRAAELLRSQAPGVPDALERLLERQQETEAELKSVRSTLARAEAARMAADASDGLVVARKDGLDQVQLKELAMSLRDQPGVRAAVLIGSPDGRRVALVGAVAKGTGLVAAELISEAARLVGGGG